MNSTQPSDQPPTALALGYFGLCFRLHLSLIAVLSRDSHGNGPLGALQLQLQVLPLLHDCSRLLISLFVGILKSFCSAQLSSEILLETRCVSSARHPA